MYLYMQAFRKSAKSIGEGSVRTLGRNFLIDRCWRNTMLRLQWPLVRGWNVEDHLLEDRLSKIAACSCRYVNIFDRGTPIHTICNARQATVGRLSRNSGWNVEAHM